MSDRDIFGNLRYDFVSPYIRFDKKKKKDRWVKRKGILYITYVYE